MICGRCGTANRTGRRFCSSCGSQLEVACPTCGSVNEPDERFCGACGSPMLAPPPRTPLAHDLEPGDAPSGAAPYMVVPGRQERKVATILFADLVGFTSLNEAHDPEMVQALVARAFDLISAEANRYEGLIEKFAGDAMLVLFGVPQSHEDDPERAVRAALEMQAVMGQLAADLRAEHRPELSLRIGIDTGEVLVDQGRAASERDRMVTGDPVNTAARFQALAQPGGVLVGAGTYAATRDLIEYEELEPAALKGKSNPTPVWRAITVRSRRDGRSGTFGIESALVGRDNEISLLKETVRRTATDGRPHLVTVIGAAGVGKSRLIWELEKYLDGLPESYVWRKGRCLAYAQPSFGALADVIRADAEIFEDDEASVAADKLDARLATLALTFGARQHDVISGMLGLEDVPQVGRDELFDTWRAYLEALAKVAPSVLVFEDVHWADEGLLDFIENMARWSEGPILLLCIARHELLERRASWAGGVRNAASIVLEPLGRTENAQLLDGLMPGGIPAVLQQRILELSDGNPLFTEELVRMFVDRGVIRWTEGRWQLAQAVDELEVPGSVQAVLAARLDALPAQEKQLAQDAAVVGRIFWDAVLSFLAGQQPSRVDDLLRRLRVKELIVPRAPSSLLGASEFGFRHVLIRDVAYDSLSKRERAAKHRFVAEWAEHELNDRGDDNAELLASHYLSALQYEEQLAEASATIELLRAEAFRHARRASSRAGRLYDRAGATRWGRVAIELAQRLDIGPVERAEVALELLDRGLGYWTLDEAERVSGAALAVLASLDARSADDVELEARIRASRAGVLHGQGRVDDAAKVLEDQIDRLADGAPTAARALLLARLGWLTWRSRDAHDAIPILQSALTDARATKARSVEAWAVHELGIASAQTGHVSDGIALVRQSMELARELGDSTLFLRSHTNQSSIMMSQGAPLDEVEALILEGLQAARRNSDRSIEGWLLYQLGEVNVQRARLGDAIETLTVSRDIAQQLGEHAQVRDRRGTIALAEARRGNWDEVARLELEGPLFSATPEAQNLGWSIMWTAWRLWNSDPDAATAHLAEALPHILVDVHVAADLLGRMALRTRSPHGLVVARDAVAPLRPDDGPLIAAMQAKAHALADGGEPTADILIGLARDFETRQYLLLAEFTWADAALILARSGKDAREALQRVAAIDAIGGWCPSWVRYPRHAGSDRR